MASDIEFLNYLYKDMWWEISGQLNLNMKKVSYLEKKKKEKNFDLFIDKIIKHIINFPKASEDREKWRIVGNSYIDKIIEVEDTFKLGTIDKNMKEQFFRSTKKFINECKNFDEDIDYNDIGQAMRNVWIVNIFQKVMGRDIEFSNAIFGYSMLYPYTDNYLDNTKISLSNKQSFNKRFSSRLNGEEITSINSHEDKVYKLVEHIESVFNRKEYPKVYESLLLIHEGQKKSLYEQEIISIPYERDMLSISIEKGGASVLADGYLVCGDLTKEEKIFAYGYGFFLQLCDDLQDVKEDIKNNHMTIISQLAGKYDLDVIINKLINITIEIVDKATCFKGNNILELKELIKNNCITMILFAIVASKDYFSKEYINTISKYLPFSLNYVITMETTIKNKFKILKPSYSGVKIDDILIYLFEVD
ncbi:MAG: class 1 isoprenoid biosynthesis enzyme [Clostridium sp.]